jgi:hypothetical protein
VNLSTKNFGTSLTHFSFDDGIKAQIVPVKLFYYETSTGLYDVFDVYGGRYYRINSGKWATSPHPIHYEIEKFFKLGHTVKKSEL